MGRAARRKRANGGRGFFRQAHVRAALAAQDGVPRATAEPALPTEEARNAEEARPDGATNDPAHSAIRR